VVSRSRWQADRRAQGLSTTATCAWCQLAISNNTIPGGRTVARLSSSSVRWFSILGTAIRVVDHLPCARLIGCTTIPGPIKQGNSALSCMTLDVGHLITATILRRFEVRFSIRKNKTLLGLAVGRHRPCSAPGYRMWLSLGAGGGLQLLEH
jgi:hypothetical protein